VSHPARRAAVDRRIGQIRDTGPTHTGGFASRTVHFLARNYNLDTIIDQRDLPLLRASW
jgi:hypothetical protein